MRRENHVSSYFKAMKKQSCDTLKIHQESTNVENMHQLNTYPSPVMDKLNQQLSMKKYNIIEELSDAAIEKCTAK